MVDIPVRMRQRSGPSLPSRTELHIYRDPPKAVITRKKERVSEADVMWVTRPDGSASDPTRINEGISQFAKGVNPSVEVSYQNYGGSRSGNGYLPVNQSGSLYKLDVVRPPLFPVETLVPLSRPRIHQNKSVETNPGSQMTALNTIAYDYDRSEAKTAVMKGKASGPLNVTPSAYYKLEQPTVMSARFAINENTRNIYDITANMSDLNNYVDNTSKTTKTAINQNNINAYNVMANVNDINNYVDNTPKSTKTAINDNTRNPYDIISNPNTYKKEDIDRDTKRGINENNRQTYSVTANPNLTMDQLVSREETAFGTIIRPKYSVTSNVSSQKLEDRNDDASAKVKKEVLLGNIRPNFSVTVYDPKNHTSIDVSSNIKQKNNIAVRAALGLPIELERQNGTKIRLKDYNWIAVQSNVGVDQVVLTIENPDIQLERNLPLYATNSSVSAPTNLNQTKNAQYELERKLNVDAQTNLDLSNLYNQDRLRNNQDNVRLKNVVGHGGSSFDIPANYIPEYMDHVEPQSRIKDNSRNKQAHNNFFNRLFE